MDNVTNHQTHRILGDNSEPCMFVSLFYAFVCSQQHSLLAITSILVLQTIGQDIE